MKKTYEILQEAHLRKEHLAPLWDISVSMLALLLATLLGYLFYAVGFTEANIITVYILGVVILSVVTTNRLCSLLASVGSVLIFNFFFGSGILRDVPDHVLRVIPDRNPGVQVKRKRRTIRGGSIPDKNTV